MRWKWRTSAVQSWAKLSLGLAGIYRVESQRHSIESLSKRAAQAARPPLSRLDLRFA